MIGILKEILRFTGLRSAEKPMDSDPIQLAYFDALIKLNEANSAEWQEVKEQYLRDLAQCLSAAMQNADVNPKVAVENLLKARIYHDLVYTAYHVAELKRDVIVKVTKQKIQSEAAKELYRR